MHTVISTRIYNKKVKFPFTTLKTKEPTGIKYVYYMSKKPSYKLGTCNGTRLLGHTVGSVSDQWLDNN